MSTGVSPEMTKCNNIFLMNENVDENEEYEQSEIKHALLDSVENYSATSKNFDEKEQTEKNSTKKYSNKLIVVKENNNENESEDASINSSNMRKKRLDSTPRTQTTEPSKESNDDANRKFPTRSRKKSNRPRIQIPNDVFVELKELKAVEDEFSYEKIYEWRETSRWIKYEQDLDYETGLWSKPYVAPLLYQSLSYLKTGLQYGTVLLDLECESYEELVEEVIQDFINSGHMNKEAKEDFRMVMGSDHVHSHQIVQHNNHLLNRKKSFIMDNNHIHSQVNNLRKSLTNIDNPNAGDGKIFSISGSESYSALHKSQVAIDMHGSETNLEGKANHKLRRDSSVKFHSHHEPPSHASEYGSSTPLKSRRTTLGMINSMKNSVLHLSNNKSDINLKAMSDDAESCILMVGVVDFLDRPVMALIRLYKSNYIDNFAEVDVKVRFIFVLLGPKNSNIDYFEIGRCMGSLMTHKEFHDCAYTAYDRRELIDCIAKFTHKSICLVLPIGDYDRDLLEPVVEWIQHRINKKKKKLTIEMKQRKKKLSMSQRGKFRIERNKFKLDDDDEEREKMNDLSRDTELDEKDPFKRTGCLFGGLLSEVKTRYPKYFSDLKDAFDIHCLIAFIFVLTVCLAPALTFGGILADKTDNWFGVNEMLIATATNGLIFGLFSGQPLMIFGSTGPFLVFEEMLFNFCKYKLCIELLPTRFWVSIWVLVYALIMTAFEGVFVVEYVTRFTEEIFAILIAFVFLSDAIKKVFKIFLHDPLYRLEKSCRYLEDHKFFKDSNENLTYFTMNKTNNHIYADSHSSCLLYQEDHFEEMKLLSDTPNHYLRPAEPNVALLSLILLIGTCVIALGLKKLRRSKFFGSYVRRTLSDVGILIAILTMVGLDNFVQTKTGIKTEKLDIPEGFNPTKSDKRDSWLVYPFGDSVPLPLWVPFTAALPAFLVFIVLFFEVELTGVMLNAPHRKLKKGAGFNIDLLLGALMMALNSLFGLPWMCAAPVRTLAHYASLTIYSKPKVPGEKPHLVEVKEQRVTNICVHLAIGCFLMAKHLLKNIPISVLFGIFLYFGIVSLSGTQLFERIKLIFKPSKYCPNVAYARGVRPVKRNIFTIIQIVGVIVLLALKTYIKISYTFPIVLALLVPFRKFVLPKFFSQKELEQLDQEKEDEEDEDIYHDFYELAHLPI